MIDDPSAIPPLFGDEARVAQRHDAASFQRLSRGQHVGIEHELDDAGQIVGVLTTDDLLISRMRADFTGVTRLDEGLRYRLRVGAGPVAVETEAHVVAWDPPGFWVERRTGLPFEAAT